MHASAERVDTRTLPLFHLYPYVLCGVTRTNVMSDNQTDCKLYSIGYQCLYSSWVYLVDVTGRWNWVYLEDVMGRWNWVY
jgi:hypothetical protein